jgi:high-affinity iron transporter
MLLLLGAVGEEYREAFDPSGRLVQPLELDEARLLLAEARDLAPALGPAATTVTAGLATLAAAIDARAPLASVVGEVDALRGTVRRDSGVVDEAAPSVPPSPGRGETVFRTHCRSCHGERGKGDGPDAAGLGRRPADFTDPGFMRGETPLDFFHVISVGRRVAAMPDWGDVLTVEERWDAVAYLWSLARSREELAEGQGIFVTRCAGCHGASGEGSGPWAAGLLSPVSDLSAADRLLTRSDADLFAVVSDGVAGTAMPAFARTLDEQERWKVVAFVRSLGLGGVPGPPAGADGPTPSAGSGGDTTRAALAETSRLLDAAVDAHRRGDVAAAAMATDAYFRFEPLEPRLLAGDAALVRRVEEGFLRLRTMLRAAAPVAEVERLAAEIGRDLAAVGRRGSEPGDAYARFLQSATIILREGFEAVLIVGALLAWVARAGRSGMRRAIWGGTGLGLAASVATAALLSTVVARGPATAELLEGAALLLAAVVLFWVSYWLVSKAEAERWQRYIRGKVDAALVSGSATALAATAFLAVYREGVETVLFYQALLGIAPAGDAMVAAGFAAGLALLGVVSVGLRGLGLRVPVTQFFRVTGSLLYAMAIVFAGKGVRALQEVDLVSVTPLAGAPTIGFLGVFPTLESLVVQAVFVGLLGWAVVVAGRARRAGRRAEREAVRTELARLRELADAMRTEIAGLRAVDDAVSPGLGARLDGLIERVRDLEARVSPGNGRP